MPKLFFDMEIVDEYGKVHGHLRREIHEDAAYMGNRTVGEMNLGAYDFDSAVRIMKVREFRKKLLMDVAKLGGIALAEHLEDREGWHGLDRQERVEAQYQPSHQ